MGVTESDGSPRSGRMALVALGSITVLVLVVMLVVLTRETTDESGPRTPPSSVSSTASTAAATSSTAPPANTTTAPGRPGVGNGARTLDDLDDWTAPIVGDNGNCDGPTYQDGVLAIACSNRQMMGFDAVTGEQIWSIRIDDRPVSGAVGVPRRSGDHRLVTGDNQSIVSVDAKTGEIMWHLERTLGVTSVSTSGSHVMMIGNGKASSVDATTGAPQWEIDYPTDLFTPGGLRTDSSDTDLLTVSGTGVHSLNLETGAMRWRTTVAGEPAADLRASHDDVYVLAHSGRITALAATDGSVRWEAEGFTGNYQAVAAIDDERVYVVSSSRISALNRSDGSTVWTSTSGELIGSDDSLNVTVLSGDRLLLLGPGTLFVLAPETGAIAFRESMNLGAPGVIHGDSLLTVLEPTGSPGAPGRLVTYDLR